MTNLKIFFAVGVVGWACTFVGCGDTEVACPSAQTDCGDVCASLSSDSQNCGACGNVCGAGQACAGSECVAIDACETPSTGTAAITVSTPDGDATEGGSGTAYNVALASQPCTNVFITLTPDAELTTDKNRLVFTPDDWDTAQRVAVDAVFDFEQEGAHTGAVSHTVASGDPAYAALAAGDATVNVVDRAHLTFVSAAVDGLGANGLSSAPVVSNNGRWVAFESEASDLTPGDSGDYNDVFLKDMSTGLVQRITENTRGEEGDDNSSAGEISSDGSRLTFFSRASNLTGDSVTGSGEVFQWDATGGVQLVSATCPRCNTEISTATAISGDGAFIAYTTRRRLRVTDSDNEYDVFVYRVSDGALTHESLNSADQNGLDFWGSNAFTPTLSADGEYVGFTSAAANLDTPEITVQNFHSYLKERTGRGLSRVSQNDGGDTNCDGNFRASSSGAPRISSDGNLAVFDSACDIGLATGSVGDVAGFRDVFVRSLSAETTDKISVAANGTDEADGNSFLLDISDDGRYVLFTSEATNLVAGDSNDARDLFLHDRTGGTTRRVSLDGSYGEIAEGVTLSGALSRNGQFAVFVTEASLVPEDDNGAILDVYLVQLF